LQSLQNHFHRPKKVDLATQEEEEDIEGELDGEGDFDIDYIITIVP
jgi:hypothetical protein